MGLVVDITAPSGWSRTVATVPAVPFSGDRAVATTRLDLAGVVALAHRIDAQTGVPNSSYAVAVRPQISLQGSISGRTFRDSFDRPVNITVTAEQAFVGAVPGSRAVGPAASSQQGAGAVPARLATRIGIRGQGLAPSTIRDLARGAALLGVIALAASVAFWPSSMRATMATLRPELPLPQRFRPDVGLPGADLVPSPGHPPRPGG
jgi:hypothetical protein